jgi:RimJ/RimL family protein N-acetyltransferase
MARDMAGVALETERLLLRGYRESDWEAVRAIDADPEVQRYRGGEIATEDQTRSWLRRTEALAEAPCRVHYPFAVVLRAEGPLIGGCGLNLAESGGREGELWYVLHRDCWGYGLATEAARAVVQFGFGELGVHRVWAQCVPENVGSLRVMEKLGMRREAHLRENQWFGGRWWDTEVYGLLDREWVEAGG